MPAGQRPLIRRRLRLELRQERERAGKSQAEVAKRMDWSLSKIIRLEAGQVGISTNDLKAMLDLYRVSNEERRAFLIELARSARQQSSWWSAYRDITPSSDFDDFLGYENDASRIRTFCPFLLPGLLQTEDYAREVIADGGPRKIDEATNDRLVQLRMARKEHILDRDDAPELDVIVDEAVLRRVVGGPEVMSDQLSSVAEVAAAPGVSIQVVPFSAGAHPGMGGQFQILAFRDPADPPVLQFDAAPRDVTLRDDPQGIQLYVEAFEQLRNSALSTEESLDLINEAAERLAQEAESN